MKKIYVLIPAAVIALVAYGGYGKIRDTGALSIEEARIIAFIACKDVVAEEIEENSDF